MPGCCDASEHPGRESVVSSVLGLGAVVYVFVRRGLRRLIEPPTPVREPDSVTLWRCCLQDGIWIAMPGVLTLAWGSSAQLFAAPN